MKLAIWYRRSKQMIVDDSKGEQCEDDRKSNTESQKQP